jgi:hypothetical protein
MVKHILGIFVFLATALFTVTSFATDESDPLPSWNNTKNKKSIIEFVNAVTDKSSDAYVAPENRIATIDNDGTLWLEKPIYTQVIFMLNRVKQLADKHPEWKTTEPFQSVLNNHYENLQVKDFEKILAATSNGMQVEDNTDIMKKWLATTNNPHFKRHYTQLVYQPMLEVINYLHQNNFDVYIVSGGGQEFVRAFANDTYHIPQNKVIGSASKIQYAYEDGEATLTKTAEPLILSNYAGKPEAIYLFIGKKPIIAIGNSDGDRQMLEWTQSNEAKTLMMLIHHDDAKREYAYDTQSKVGTFSTSLMDEAKENHWQIISMKNDWKTIFPGQE